MQDRQACSVVFPSFDAFLYRQRQADEPDRGGLPLFPLTDATITYTDGRALPLETAAGQDLVCRNSRLL